MNIQTIAKLQAAISVGAVICLIIGWFNLLSPELNFLLYHKIFYILVGVSFILSAGLFPKPLFRYISIAAAAMCFIGVLVDENSPLTNLKTIGLLVGVVASFLGRPRQVQS